MSTGEMSTPEPCGCRIVWADKARTVRGVRYCPTHDAALDLLAALEEIGKPDPGPDAFGGDLESIRRLYEWAASMKREARAAIAKAKGETI